MAQYTIWQALDDAGDELVSGQCYALYPRPDELPYVGPLEADDAVQLGGEVAWCEWDYDYGRLFFVDSDGEPIDIARFEYARRQL